MHHAAPPDARYVSTSGGSEEASGAQRAAPRVQERRRRPQGSGLQRDARQGGRQCARDRRDALGACRRIRRCHQRGRAANHLDGLAVGARDRMPARARRGRRHLPAGTFITQTTHFSHMSHTPFPHISEFNYFFRARARSAHPSRHQTLITSGSTMRTSYAVRSRASMRWRSELIRQKSRTPKVPHAQSPARPKSRTRPLVPPPHGTHPLCPMHSAGLSTQLSIIN